MHAAPIIVRYVQADGRRVVNEIGARARRMHLGRVLEMAESSADRYSYERKIAQRFGGQQELELVAPSPEPPSAAS